MGTRPVEKEPRNSGCEEGWGVRVLLVAALVLLFLWLHCAQTAPGPPCEPSSPATAASLLLSPLLLYSWLTATLARAVLAAPALLLSALRQSLLLLLAGPWALLCFWAALALACLQAAVYLVHLALVLGAAAGVAAAVSNRKS